jgi:hypothetical protein
MSFDLQAEGLNGVNVQTSVVAGHDWDSHTVEGAGSPASTVLFVSGLAFDIASPANIDAVAGRGRLFGNGVTGWGGDQGGAGLVGVAGGVLPAGSGVAPVTGQSAGVYGTGVVDGYSSPAVGVIGQGGPATPGVVGQAGTGNADGVRGFGSRNFSGVAGFGDPTGSGIGVYGEGRGPNSVGVRGFGNGNSSGVEGFGNAKGNGTGVYGQGGGPHAQGVRGIGGGGTPTAPFDAAGVYGQAGAGNANGVEGRGSGNFAGVAGFGDVTNSANSGIGVFAVGGAPQPGSGHFGGPGVYAVGNGGPGYVQINQPLGIYGVGGGDNAPGVFGIGAGGPAFTPVSQAAGIYGIGGSGNAPGVVGQGGAAVGDGVQGFSASGNGVSGESVNSVGVRATSTSSTGLVAVGTRGLFAASTAAPGPGTAAEFDGNVLVVNGNFTVTGGAKSVAVPFPDGSHRRLYCVESPENWFEDFGFGELSDGEARVQLEDGFRSVVDSDAYHVFITEYEDNNALYVAERTSTGFLVRTKGSKASGTFSYRVVAKRRDITAPRFDTVLLQPARPAVGHSRNQPEPVIPVAA